jgi:hypothetical protein
MKYLKKYKIFENIELEQDIKDVLVELYDMSLDINYIVEEENIIITIHKIDKVNNWLSRSSKFQFTPIIKQIIIRLTHLLYEYGYKKRFFSTNSQSKIIVGNIRTNRKDEYKGKEFILRPDMKFKYTNGAWIDDNEEVMDIRLNFYGFYKPKEF